MDGGPDGVDGPEPKEEMMTELRLALSVLLSVCLLCPASRLMAQNSQPENQTFCIEGTSDGVGWRIDLSAPGTVVGLPLSAEEGTSATGLAQASVQRINAGDQDTFSAEFECTDPDGSAYFSIAGPLDFTFSVSEENGMNPCQVTGNPAGCSFNPEVVDIATIPDFELVCSILDVPTLDSFGLAILTFLLILTALTVLRLLSAR